MGCCFSNQPGFHDVISDELITYELAGEMLDDDYLGQSYLFLRKYKPEPPQSSTTTSSSLSYDDAVSQLYLDLSSAYLILNPNYMNELENGYVRGSDGSWYISCTIDLGNCNGEMFDWWYRACDSSDRYRWTQPTTHTSCSWEPSFSHTHLSDRKPGYYIDFLQTVEIQLSSDINITTTSNSNNSISNNKKKKKNNYLFTFSYERPSKHFDMSKFQEQNVTACICARIHSYDCLVGWISVGYVIHIVRRCTNKTELDITITNRLESRYWFGQNIHKMAHTSCLCRPMFVHTIGNTKSYRQFKFSENFIKSIWLHCYQEMNCLKKNLPHFYNKSIKMGLVYGKKSNEKDENENDPILLSVSSNSSKSSHDINDMPQENEFHHHRDNNNTSNNDHNNNIKTSNNNHNVDNDDDDDDDRDKFNQPPSVSVTTTPRNISNNNMDVFSDRSIISEATSCGVMSVMTEQHPLPLPQSHSKSQPVVVPPLKSTTSTTIDF